MAAHERRRPSFPIAIDVLVEHAIVNHSNEMVYLTPLAEQHRYSGKARAGLRMCEDEREFWDSVVAELDLALA